MEKPLHPDYIYIDSELLKQRVAYHKKSGWLFCQDKYPDGSLVSYSPKELKVFEDSGDKITMAVHTVKKVFTGEVVGYERTGGKGNGPGPGNGSRNGGEIQGNTGNVPIVRDGELEIF
jgi:hypothetical protein